MLKVFFFLGSLLPGFCFTVIASEESSQGYHRVISLSPSITEILFELNLGERLVGVTPYCTYPPEAQEKTSVGGLLDPNFELIYKLNPDLVIYHEGATSHEQTLNAMHLHTLKTISTSISGILDSIKIIGELFGRKIQATALIKSIRDTIDLIELRTKGSPKPRVLVTYWRPLGEGQITEAYIAGNDTFFNDLIRIAGGVNCYDGPQAIISPLISAEGILQLNPDVIIEIKGTLHESGFSVKEILKDWKNLAVLDAYKNKKIFVLHKQYTGIPGPRITQTMRDIALCIHPHLTWD